MIILAINLFIVNNNLKKNYLIPILMTAKMLKLSSKRIKKMEKNSKVNNRARLKKRKIKNQVQATKINIKTILILTIRKQIKIRGIVNNIVMIPK